MKIKLDENIVATAKEVLIENRNATQTIPEQNIAGWTDTDVWRAIQDEGRFLVTQDQGFGDVRQYPPGFHYGILLLRPGTAFPDGLLLKIAT